PGALTYLLLRDIAGLPPGAIGAACGCVIAALLLLRMLLGGRPPPRPLLPLLLTALVAVALNRALAAYADGVAWTRATPDDWVTTAALSFLGAGVIAHVAVGLRWPFAARGGLGAT